MYVPQIPPIIIHILVSSTNWNVKPFILPLKFNKYIYPLICYDKYLFVERRWQFFMSKHITGIWTVGGISWCTNQIEHHHLTPKCMKFALLHRIYLFMIQGVTQWRPPLLLIMFVISLKTFLALIGWICTTWPCDKFAWHTAVCVTILLLHTRMNSMINGIIHVTCIHIIKIKCYAM